jgi:hypothetical protein
VRVPDYISPIVAYRLWQWDSAGLRSLNGARWIPAQALAARCSLRKVWIAGRTMHVDHDAPKADCRCGVYASKSLDDLRSIRVWESGVRGEAWLWGTVVEHERGWRAQFAYPRTLVLPADILPIALTEIQSRLESLVAYCCDIFIAHDGGSVPIWGNDSGLDPDGLDFLMSRGKDWYARRRRTLKRGDCVAIGGRGIAVVEHADGMRVHAVLGKREWVRLLRRDIAWNDTYSRWEASVSA